MVKTFLVTLTLIVAMPLAAPADACDCASLPACHALWAADSVFVGRVERVARGDGRPRHAEVRVERWLRGEQPGPRVVIDTRGAGISCDAISFEEGRRYLVYAVRGAQGEWRTKLCGGTMPLEFAAKALDYARRTLGRSSPGRLSGFAFIDVLQIRMR